MRERKFKYDWTRAREGKPDDYICWEGGYDIGRVMLHTSGGAALWIWHMGDDRPGRIWAASGSSDDRDAACHALEAAFDNKLAESKKARQP